jgi:hypothetical protein
MKQLLGSILLFACLGATAQKQFFKSEQKFSEKELQGFYSSINIQDSVVLFIANDYAIYAYDKNTRQQKWRHYMSYKTNTPAHVAAGYVWTNKGEYEALRISLDGTDPKSLPFSIYSSPYTRNGLLFFTGLYEAGNVLAYDVKADTVRWYRFIAHGCEVLPYYLDDRIIANTEGDSWVELDYNGNFLEKNCDTEEDGYPGEKCRKEFMIRTHDNKYLTEEAAGKMGITSYSDKDVFTTNDRTIILEGENLFVIGNKLKKKTAVVMYELSDEIEPDDYGYSKILKADNKSIWLLYNEKLLILDADGKKISRLVDLKEWRPHRAVADGNAIWLINRNDGLLYGITVD